MYRFTCTLPLRQDPRSLSSTSDVPKAAACKSCAHACVVSVPRNVLSIETTRRPLESIAFHLDLEAYVKFYNPFACIASSCRLGLGTHGGQGFQRSICHPPEVGSLTTIKTDSSSSCLSPSGTWNCDRSNPTQFEYCRKKGRAEDTKRGDAVLHRQQTILVFSTSFVPTRVVD